MSELCRFLIQHPALTFWLGFERVPDPASPWGFEPARTVPIRRHFSTVLRTLPTDALQFLLDASVQLLRDTLPPDQPAGFGDTIAGDTQALLAWVRENNPKQFIKQGRLDIFWGYASGLVATRLPDHTEVVLAERTRPFNEDDSSYFEPLMQQVEARLGRKPRSGAWDTAFDAQFVYQYFHDAGGFAAVPLNPGKKGAGRQFAPDGTPLCAASLPMTLQFRYAHRTGHLHTREKFGGPLLHPEARGQACPIADAHFAKGGCATTLAAGAGSRLRHTLDRESEVYKTLYAKRTMVERINAQAEGLGMLHPKLRRGRAIATRNTLTYVLINLRGLQRVRTTAAEVRPTES